MSLNIVPMDNGSPDLDDREFVQQLSMGDPRALRAFESRCRGLLMHAFGRAVARWKPERPVHADDYVQDFVGHLFSDGGRRLRTYSGRARFTSWLYTVALRYFQRALSQTRQDRRTVADHSSVQRIETHTPEDDAILAEDIQHLHTSLGTLSAEEQLLIKLFFIDGLNATEVSAAMGYGTSAVRMRKKRILNRLREALQDTHGGVS